MILSILLAVAAQTSPWEPLKLPEPAAGKTLRGVATASPQSVWIVGDQGLCLTSKDAGRSWTLKPLSTIATLRAVRFFTDKAGMIVGDGDPDAPKATGHIVMGRRMTAATVLWTLDAGETWKKGHPPTNFEIVCAERRGGPVQFGNSGGENHLDGDVLRSSGGIDAWTGKDFKSNRCFRAIFDIRALDADRWVAVGSPVSVGFTPPPKDALYTSNGCRALLSRDGGETWAPSSGSDGEGCLRGLAAGPSRLLAVGDGGAIVSSDDRGETWKARASGCAQDLFAVASAAQAALAVGDKETTLLSSDGGQTWKRTSSGAGGAFLAVAVLGDAFLIVGDGGMARRASTKALLAAKAAAPPKEPAKAAPKGPTKAQLERVQVGAVAVYEVNLDAPAMNMKINYHQEQKISAVTASGYTIDFQVVKGTPPAGSPTKGSAQAVFDGGIDYSTWKVGDKEDQSDKSGKSTRTRLPDEPVRVGEKSLDCIVIDVTAQTADGANSVRTKYWFAKSTEVPAAGIVRQDTLQETEGPQGKIRLTQTLTLLSYRRGN